jgi:hypothetical protein
LYGRGDWIRTSDLYVPNVALYQAEPHLEKDGSEKRSLAAEEGFEPSQTESESVVLPLHNSAIFIWNSKSYYTKSFGFVNPFAEHFEKLCPFFSFLVRDIPF